jgi:1-acyl-sn-glycerol-3-phosphate acyltransferase
MLLIRSLIYYFGSTLTLIIFSSLSLVILLVNKKAGISIVLWWNRFVLFWLRLCCGVRVEIQQETNTLPKPCIVVSNHQSAWETIFLQLKFYPLTTVLKKELLNIPFFGWGLRILEPIAIDRSQPIQALKLIKKTALKRLQAGKNVLIFPEGTRNPVGELGSYTRSAADIAKRAAVPIVPIVHNAGSFWLNKQLIKKPGTIKVIIGEAVYPSDKDTKVIMENIETWTQTKLKELNPSSKNTIP